MRSPFKFLTTLGFSVALCGSCGTSEDKNQATTTRQNTPQPIRESPPAQIDKVPDAHVAEPVSPPSISSVQLDANCPDPTTARSRKSRPAAGVGGRSRSQARQGRGKSVCRQSTVQIAFSGQSDHDSEIQIKKVTLLRSSDGGQLASLKWRMPGQWTSEGYQPWDEKVKASGEVQATYKLSAPNWTELEKVTGRTGSFGVMFILEMEIAIDGQTVVVRSPEFGRYRRQNIRT